MKSIVDLVYEYLPYDWDYRDASVLREDVLADIRAHEEAAAEAAFTAVAQECMHRARRLWDVYDTLEVLATVHPYASSVEDAWAKVQARKEANNG